MSSATERFHDPVHGVTFRFEAEDDRLRVFAWLEPGGRLPEHLHPTLEERWEVLDGTAVIKVDGRWSELTAEDAPVVVGRGIRHELRNTSEGVAHLRATVTPAGRLQEFLVDSAQAAREGLYNARNLPTGLRGAAWLSEFALRFGDETVMCSPPPALQRVVLPVAARLTRRWAPKRSLGTTEARIASRRGRPDRLTQACGVAVPSVLLAIAALHAAWALGSYWPAGSEQELAALVLASGERERLDGALPPASLTWLVVAGLTGAATAVRAVAAGNRSRALRGAGWGVAGTFLVRGLVFPPLDVINGLDDRYDRLDLTVYSPLCLALSAATAVVMRRTAGAQPRRDHGMTRSPSLAVTGVAQPGRSP